MINTIAPAICSIRIIFGGTTAMMKMKSRANALGGLIRDSLYNKLLDCTISCIHVEKVGQIVPDDSNHCA